MQESFVQRVGVLDQSFEARRWAAYNGRSNGYETRVVLSGKVLPDSMAVRYLHWGIKLTET